MPIGKSPISSRSHLEQARVTVPGQAKGGPELGLENLGMITLHIS